MNLNEKQMLDALKALAAKLSKPVKLVVGGGGAILLTHIFPLATTDIDAIPAAGSTPEELDPLVKSVAAELSLAPDWLNPYYATFTHVLPGDYGARLVEVLKQGHLTVMALSREDLLIMKCFAGRMKDRTHAKALVEAGANLKMVEAQLEQLLARGIPGAQKALDFLDEITG